MQCTQWEAELLAYIPPVKSCCWTCCNLQALICPLFGYVGNSTLRALWWRGDSGSTHAWNFIKSTLCFHLPETQLFLISGLPMNELYSASINLGSFHLCSEIVGPEIREWAWLCNYTLYFIFHPGCRWKKKPILDSKSHYRRQGIYDTCLRWNEEIGGRQENVSAQLRFWKISECYHREVIDGSSERVTVEREVMQPLSDR